MKTSAGQCEGLRTGAPTYTSALSFLLASGTGSAQLTTADIVGTVTDQTGAVIPNASVKLLNLETHDQRTASSNVNGDFQFTLLPVGHYSVSIAFAGFKTEPTTNLVVEAGDRAR